MNNNITLNPERKNLLAFLNEIKNIQFVIPVYQRNYTWQHNVQVKKFLNDIFNIDEDIKSYFIGIIMYLSRELNFNKRST